MVASLLRGLRILPRCFNDRKTQYVVENMGRGLPSSLSSALSVRKWIDENVSWTRRSSL